MAWLPAQRSVIFLSLYFSVQFSVPSACNYGANRRIQVRILFLAGTINVLNLFSILIASRSPNA
jgi:hypothetical protein